jgi:hypothetical protein
VHNRTFEERAKAPSVREIRNRFHLLTLGARIVMLPMEPASLLMERQMLRGIKERAEQLASSDKSTATTAV